MKDAEEPTKIIRRTASLPHRHSRKNSEGGLILSSDNAIAKPDLKRSISLSLPRSIPHIEPKSTGVKEKCDENRTNVKGGNISLLTPTEGPVVKVTAKIQLLPTCASCSSQFSPVDSSILKRDGVDCKSAYGYAGKEMEARNGSHKSAGDEEESKTESQPGDLKVPVPPPIPEEWRVKLAQTNHNDTSSENKKHARIPIPPPLPPSPANIDHEDNTPLELELLNHCCLHLNDLTYDHDFDSVSDSYADSYDLELCGICYQSFSSSGDNLLMCRQCDVRVCKQCMKSHLQNTIMEGFIQLCCPGDSCSRAITDSEIEKYCDAECVTLYFKNKVDAENNPRRKTCPGCNKIHSFEDEEKIPKKVKCSVCHLDWCARCHAPWHSGMTCKQYQADTVGNGRKALKVWAKSIGKDSANAKKCPSCKFFIERISGCDHMTCNR